jgi:hypothetical protein
VANGNIKITIIKIKKCEQRKCVREAMGGRGVYLAVGSPWGRNINRHSLNTQWRAREINYNRIYGCFNFEADLLKS